MADAEVTEPWLEDEDAFFAHFDIPHSDFCELIRLLSKEQQRKYERTRKVNVEAAILWAIHEGKNHGLLVDVPDTDEERLAVVE